MISIINKKLIDFNSLSLLKGNNKAICPIYLRILSWRSNDKETLSPGFLSCKVMHRYKASFPKSSTQQEQIHHWWFRDREVSLWPKMRLSVFRSNASGNYQERKWRESGLETFQPRYTIGTLFASLRSSLAEEGSSWSQCQIHNGPVLTQDTSIPSF